MSMKLKFLGTGVAFVACNAAMAAELHVKKEQFVEYVKVCSSFGAGFFYIPGSNTCLKFGGEMRAYYLGTGGTSFSRDDHRSAFYTQARIGFDVRTQTEWGVLRSYIQIKAESNKPGKAKNYFSIGKAYIQLGGLTAGYAHSFFGFYDLDYGNTIWAPYYAQDSTVDLIAYTAQLETGLRATLSIEDGRDHRVKGDVYPGTGLKQGGQEIPDVVGQLRWDQNWGSIALQGAAHEFRTDQGVAPKRDKYGWAAGGTVLLKLPFFTDGHFIAEWQYANGALDYLGAGNTAVDQTDYFRKASGGIAGGKGWSVVAELGVNITRTLQGNVVGSYINTTYDRVNINEILKISEYIIAANMLYTIAKGLSVSPEIAYTRGELDGILSSANVRNEHSYGSWQGGIRIRRTF